jgi:hypothetical protein
MSILLVGFTRRVAGVYEVKQVGSYNRISTWDPYKDRFEKNLKDSLVLTEISETMGRSYDQLLEEISKRSTVLRWMASKGIRSYKDVASIVHLYYADPWRVYKRAVKET